MSELETGFDTAMQSHHPLNQRDQRVEMEQIPVRCPRCGAVLGRMVQRKGIPVLLSEGWFVNQGERLCPDCQGLFIVKPVKVTWDELVRRFVERNKLNGDVGELVISTAKEG